MSKYEDYTKEQLIAEIKQLKHRKKFGLVWEQHTEDVVEQCKTNFPVLHEIPQRAITPPLPAERGQGGEATHLIIEGDNYHALSVLNVTHKGKIDVIYIDPPYNTGNKDFKYNDKFVDTEDNFRHSKWLSFMQKRLKLAKNLLSESGVIFISIDDNEQAHLKLLCDEIFGEEKLISNISRITTKRVKGDTNDINKIHDYLLIYSKTNNHKIYHKPKEDYSIYDLEDEYIETRGRHLIRPLDNGTINYSSSLDYEIIAPDGSKIVAGGDIELREERLKGGYKTKDWCFRWSENKLKWGIENDFIVFKKSKNKYRVYFKIYQYVDNNLNKVVKYDNYLSVIDNCYNNQGTTEIKSILNTNVFTYPKPLSLMNEILCMATRSNSTILDFFAGSGTTGHAVLELNKEDGGNRQFILCTNNENGICEEVTYPRIKTVITGSRGDGSTYSDGIPANVRYFKTDFVKQSEDTDENRVLLTERCYELLQIKEGCYNEIKNEELRIKSLKFWRNETKLMVVIFDRYDKIDDKEYIEAITAVAGLCCSARHSEGSEESLANSTSPQPSPKEREQFPSFGGVRGGDFGESRGGVYRNDSSINDIVIYRFSIDGNLDMDISSLPNARLEEIPDEILKVYNQLFKKKRRKK